VKLVLWDIDGTLVASGGVGLEAFEIAFERITGRPLEHHVPFAGRTDLEIALDLLGVHGIKRGEEILHLFEDELAAALADRRDRILAQGRALPGAAEAIRRLTEHRDVRQSLLTGNIEANAFAKLEPFGLHEHLDFDIGAYGSDHRMRPELVAIARRKAEAKLGVPIPFHNIVLVGDTPLDVAAARHAGARAVGVATGPYDTEQLLESGAHAALDDLSDTERVLSAVLGRFEDNEHGD
jgi:phosphoglycolate phosphatase-like HAD superfamily hydrolase